MKLNNKYLLFIGIIASIIVGVGEYLLHYLPQGPGGEITMLLNVPLHRASKGHFLVVFGAPLYFAGYYGLKNIFKSTNAILSKLLFIAGMLSFSIGGVWVSSRYFAAVVLQKSNNTTTYDYFLQAYQQHYQILVWVLRFLVTFISVIYVILIIKNKQGLPKWLALFNPIVILMIVISMLFFFKPLGNHIAPIAMNLTHFIFFGFLFFQLKKSKSI